MERHTEHLTVLLVEEPGWLRDALELALALRGDAVTTIDDPAAAPERVRIGGFDLAIVGLFATGSADTVATCRALRDAASGAVPSVAPWIVACVPRGDDARALAAIDAGAGGYLSVPVEVEQLRSRLAQAERLQADLAALGLPLAATGTRPGALVERALDPLLIVSPEGTIQYASPAAESLFGPEPVGLAGESLYSFCHPDDTTRAFELISAALDSPTQSLALDLRIVDREGTVHDVDARVGNLLDEPGVEGIVLAMRDVTERKRVVAELERQALYDGLTRLPNRTLFQDYLEHALARAERRLETLVVMFFDLDNFKLVNDTFGHAVGDGLLIRVGERLRGCLRASDTAARWGGDEFTALLEDIATEHDAVAVAERVSRELSSPFSIEGREIRISASIGMAFSTPGESSPGDLLRDADVALYRAKAEGKNRWVIFESGAGFTDRWTPSPDLAAIDDWEPEPPSEPIPTPEAEPLTAAPGAEAQDDAMRALMERISALEREAGRLEAELEEERRRE